MPISNFIPPTAGQISNGFKGFTLIELIFSISVAAILSVIGVVGFAQYGRIQSLNASTLELITLINTAKSRALSQVKPENQASCATQPLVGYQVILTTLNTYQLQVRCGSFTGTIQSSSLKQSVVFDQETFGIINTQRTFFFSVLTGGMIDSYPGREIVIRHTQITSSKHIAIDATGKVSVVN